jgi:acetyltransferase-like isoleucine patch superfamily enzyme
VRKNLIKSTFRGVAILCVLPIVLCHWFTSLITDADISLESHSQLLSLAPGKIGNYLRVGFYRLTLEQCDPTATICFGTLFSKAGARIGRNVYIGPRCILGLVTLEDDVLLGPCVQIPSGPNTHSFDLTNVPIRMQPGTPKRITVGQDSWIGCNAILLKNIAEQTIVGAGSVVTKGFPSRTVIAGSPARQVSKR